MAEDEGEEYREEEVEEETEEVSEAKARVSLKRWVVILAVLGLVIFIVIVFSVSGIFTTNIPGVTELCFTQLSRTPSFDLGQKILGPEAAAAALAAKTNESPRFINTSIEFCGFAYSFNTSAGQMTVCEEGKVYGTNRTCRPTMFSEKLGGLIESLRRYFAR